MKAISLWQPWASAIALGLKKIETRHWTTAFRGPIAIHAAKRWTLDERERWLAECAMNPSLPKDIPLGAFVAVAELADVVSTDVLLATSSVSLKESEWGNYGPARYGWMFENIVALPRPIPFKGAQGLFNVPESELSIAPGIQPSTPQLPLL